MEAAPSRIGQEGQRPQRLVARRKVLLSRPDWFLALLLLVVALPTNAWQWVSLPRAPSLSEWLLLGFLVLLCITNPMALFRRDSVIELDAGGLVLPERYEQIVPWEAVMGVRLNGKDVLIDIAAGERFGRRRKGFYRLFPEQARYKGNDLQIIDANRTTVRANDLVRCIEHYMPDAVRSPA